MHAVHRSARRKVSVRLISSWSSEIGEDRAALSTLTIIVVPTGARKLI